MRIFIFLFFTLLFAPLFSKEFFYKNTAAFEDLMLDPEIANTFFSIKPVSLKNYQKNKINSDYLLYSEAGTSFFASGDSDYIPGNYGLSFKKGGNLFFRETASFEWKEYLTLYAGIRQHIFEKDNFDNELMQTGVKLSYKNISFSAGNDSVSLGPGEYGTLLSFNAKPMPTVKLFSEKGIPFFGYWHFLIMNSWLIEKREDIDNPKVHALRFSWIPPIPVIPVELGATRVTMYGGKGRPNYNILDYPKFISGSDENLTNSKFDNDAYAAFDISVKIPLKKWSNFVDSLILYYQQGGTDSWAPWQKEDRNKNLKPPFFLFKLYERVHQTGFIFKTGNHIARAEYVVTALTFYNHHIYDKEGFSYDGLILGYPYGKNMQSFFIKHRFKFLEKFFAEERVGLIQMPIFTAWNEDKDVFAPKYFFNNKDKMTKYFASLHAGIDVSEYRFSLYSKIDKWDNFDETRVPSAYRIESKKDVNFLLGADFSAEWDF